MKGFKLLAFRPLKGGDPKLLKNLKPEEIYKFYQDYEYVKDENDLIEEIRFYQKIPKILFEDNINISAVVGKNGSGKSTIIELLSGFIFCLSGKLRLINIDDFIKNHELNDNDQERLKKELKSFKSFNCELIYSIDSIIYSVKKDGANYTQNTFRLTDSTNLEPIPKIFTRSEEVSLDNPEKDISRKNIDMLYHNFFYSILANYSLYGLNTDEIGVWLKSIFHKNDGYKTPIVLNPMRTKGVIDINRITYLSKSRLLSNVFSNRYKSGDSGNDNSDIVNGKVIKYLILNLDFRKFNVVNEEDLKEGQYPQYLIKINGKSIYLDSTQKWKKSHLHFLIKSFYPNIDFSKLNAEINRSKLKQLTVEYIIRKTETIIKKYSQYQAFSRKVFRTNAVENTIQNSFDILAEDFSHSTFKLRQALNFLIYDYYEVGGGQGQKVYPLTTQDKTGISDIINAKIKKKIDKAIAEVMTGHSQEPDTSDLEKSAEFIYNKHRIINYLPPSFFSIDFEFKDKGYFKDLSSGEKQMIYSINSIIYHLINLGSISSTSFEDSVSYKHFNIILDEVELCFHPEFQRTFVNELLNAIKSQRWHNASYNLIFLTHSPFILSDIPSSNILMLEDGKMHLDNAEETYAANIHDLLANEFFLSNGFMGEYAKNKIQDLLRYLTFNENEPESEQNEKPKLPWTTRNTEAFIDTIGEPLLKYDLKELYLSKFYSEKQIDNQIEKLIALKESKKKNDLNK